ncbi:hypothetical protein ACERK3_18710 [Phycisphaerales bacterium AB-hyl4]|uniref:Alpha-L-rhamnosidase six-hairpin glycosidase domain-containing protein n=1 Tax=Natronomicrosphaera hydrolytica TaxID=3242702 RepID=A0ABV4UCI3_9BACT
MADSDPAVDVTGATPEVSSAPKARQWPPRAPLTEFEQTAEDAVAARLAATGERPSFEALAAMLPPLRYVNAPFKAYPLVLSEPEGERKIRVVSDGSAVHLGIEVNKRPIGVDQASHWNGPAWSVTLEVNAGDGWQPVCAQPRWHDGCLPIAGWQWMAGPQTLTLDVFAADVPGASGRLAAWLRCTVKGKPEATAPLRWRARLARHDDAGQSIPANLQCTGGALQDDEGHLFGGVGPGWQWDEAEQTLVWSPAADSTEHEACLLLLDQPARHTLINHPASERSAWAIETERALVNNAAFLADMAEPTAWHDRMNEVARQWQQQLAPAGSATAELPEPRVDQARQAVLASLYVIANRGQLNYSVHNPYERMYTDETGLACTALACWGHIKAAVRFFEQVTFYDQKNVMPHDLGCRLTRLCRLAQLEGDNGVILRRHGRRMRRWAQQIAASRNTEQHGLLPPTQYCGDLPQMVYSFNGNAVAWRGLRDAALALADEKLLAHAESMRAAILQAVEASTDWQANPPFVPMQLHGDEPTPTGQLTKTTLGSYWALVAPYAIASGVLPTDHPAQSAMLDTYQQRGGLCASLVRWTPQSDYNTTTTLLECGIDDLYGAGLVEAWARTDDADQLELALYGKLAIGMTHDTCYAGEIASLAESRIHGQLDPPGRSLFLPPNSAGQGWFNVLLRHILVYDFDAQGNGVPDTLRLAHATPPRWLDDGQVLAVHDMPTAFGPVSYRFTSQLNAATPRVRGVVQLPQHPNLKQVTLRLRLPHPWQLDAVHIDGQSPHPFDSDTATIDLGGLAGKKSIDVRLQRIRG